MLSRPQELVQCLRFEPKNGDPIRIVLSYPVNLTMSNGVVYQGGIYAQPSDINSNLTGSPTVIDIGSVYNIDTITRDEIQSGYWDGAKIYSFFTTWSFPAENEMADHLYYFGSVQEIDDRYTIELMSQGDLLNESTGRIIRPSCDYILGDAHVNGEVIPQRFSRCQVSSSLVSNIPSQVVSVASPINFFGSGLGSYLDDWFGYGELFFTLGNNAGLTYRLIKNFIDGGNITLADPFYFPVSVGDQFLIRAGCRKRHQEDCIIKFSNGPHFGGFPDVPQKSIVLKFGDQ